MDYEIICRPLYVRLVLLGSELACSTIFWDLTMISIIYFFTKYKYHRFVKFMYFWFLKFLVYEGFQTRRANFKILILPKK